MATLKGNALYFHGIALDLSDMDDETREDVIKGIEFNSEVAGAIYMLDDIPPTLDEVQLAEQYLMLTSPEGLDDLMFWYGVEFCNLEDYPKDMIISKARKIAESYLYAYTELPDGTAVMFS